MQNINQEDGTLPPRDVLLDGVYEYAYNLFDTGETKLAFDLFLVLANAKYASALNFLGYMYSGGYSVKKDHQKALSYYEKAHRLGDTTATQNIASVYRYDLKDYKKAKYWYRRLEKISFCQAEALFELAQMYYMGFGVKANKKKAIKMLMQVYNDDNLFYSLCEDRREEVQILVEHQNDPAMWRDFSAKPCWVM